MAAIVTDPCPAWNVQIRTCEAGHGFVMIAAIRQ